jgi:hypothetical protein
MPTKELVDLEDKVPQEDVPNEPPRSNGLDAKGALDLVSQLIKLVSEARIGRTVFDDYASRYKLLDNAAPLFYIFLFIAWLLDMTLAIGLVLIVTGLMVGIAYSVLRGLDAVGPVQAILTYLFHQGTVVIHTTASSSTHGQ